MEGRGPRLPPITVAATTTAAGVTKASPTVRPACPACGRVQYVATARCLCGHVPWIDTLDADAKREVFLANRCDAVGVLLARKHCATLALAWASCRAYVTLSRHAEKRSNHVPSTHSGTVRKQKDDIHRFLQKRELRPNSVLLQKGQHVYTDGLIAGLAQRERQELEHTLATMTKQYIGQRSRDFQKCSGAGRFASPHRRKRIVRSALLGGDPDGPLSRQKPLVSIESATCVAQVLELLREENKLIVTARKSSNKWERARLLRKQTIAEMNRQRAARAAREKREAEERARTLALARSKAEREHAQKRASAHIVFTVLMRMRQGNLVRGFKHWLTITRDRMDRSPAAMRSMQLERDKSYQVEAGKARRRLHLYGVT